MRYTERVTWREVEGNSHFFFHPWTTRNDSAYLCVWSTRMNVFGNVCGRVFLHFIWRCVYCMHARNHSLYMNSVLHEYGRYIVYCYLLVYPRSCLCVSDQCSKICVRVLFTTARKDHLPWHACTIFVMEYVSEEELDVVPSRHSLERSWQRSWICRQMPLPYCASMRLV